MLNKLRIASTSFSLGRKKVNLESKYNNFDKIFNKTGINHVWQENGNIFDLAIRSAEQILRAYDRETIDFLILITQSPVDLLPANSTTLSSKLNLKKNILTFDFNQGCSGFVQALIVAEQLLNKYKKGLLITADCYRDKIAPGDRSTDTIFSDASASVLIESDFNGSKILYEDTITDGSKRDLLYQSTSTQNINYLKMSGSEIWMFTRIKVIPQIKKAIQFCENENLKIDSIYIHQASKIVVNGIKDNLKGYIKYVHENYMKYGNTVSSSIPILMNEYPDNINNGIVIFAGFGVGLTSTVLVYGRNKR